MGPTDRTVAIIRNATISGCIILVVNADLEVTSVREIHLTSIASKVWVKGSYLLLFYLNDNLSASNTL